MNSVYRISIPKTEQPPDFPDRCLGCGFDHPDATYEIVSKRRGPAWRILHWALSHGAKIRVPLCGRCESRLRKRRIVSAIAFRGILYGTFLPLVLVFGVPGQVIQRCLLVVIALGGVHILLPLWIRWEDRHPISFDAADFGKRMEFEFTNEQLAHQFSALNDTEQEAVAFRESFDYDAQRNRTTACRT
jgi:hypothetical protein